MADQWYYVQQGQRQGPVAEEELKQLASSGQLKPTDKVWKQGMAVWTEASQVDGLIPPPDPSQPPPLEDAAQTVSEWYYVQNGQQTGPVSEQQLRQLASGGQLRPADLVWKKGMSEWVPLNQVPLSPPDPNAPPPIPTATKPKGAWLLAYRIALVLAAVSVFLPWMQLSGTVFFWGYQSSGTITQASGIHGTWGVLCLLCAIGGMVFTFFDPAKILKDEVKLGMAAIGGAIAILTVIAITIGASAFQGIGSVVEFDAHAGFGAYLAIFAGSAAAVLGYLLDWNQKQST
jgi:hypothetical protein